MAYNTPETVADYLARFQMEITHRGKGTFTPDHVKYSLTIASGGKDFFTTFESNPHVHGEPPVTWSSPSDALLRNTRKRKGRSLTTSPPANGVCILSTPESVTVSMVA